MKEKIDEIIFDITGAEDYKESDDLMNDLDFDALDIVEVAMAMEQRFGVYIPDEDLENVRTIKDLYNLINKK